jgi:threonine 3-dehydrogenase
MGAAVSRILVTGGAGFLGRALVRALAGRGDEVLSFDLSPVETPQGKVETVRGDLSAWSDVLSAVASFRPERVFHCGALLSAVAEADVLRAVRTNADGTFHVLEACRLFGVRRVLLTSTIATYGADAGDPVPEGAPQRPETIYGVTKVYAERLGEYYARRYSLDFRGIRFPSIVGPGRSATGLSAYTSTMIEEPALGRPYTVPVAERSAIPIVYVEDAVRALLELDGAAPPPRCVYNLAGISPTAGEIAGAVIQALPGARVRFDPDPAAQAVVDSWPRAIDDAPARAEWGWRPVADLDDLVARFVGAVRGMGSSDPVRAGGNGGHGETSNRRPRLAVEEEGSR